ncbi:MAG: hypothetical protein ACIAQ0_13735 [Phycisphaerales bacterium JB058]
MRKVVLLLLPICLMYFVVGGFLLWFEYINRDTYFSIGSIVGGFASVMGLLSLVRPPLTPSDMQAMNIDALQQFGRIVSDIGSLREEREKAESKISELELQKKEMELLVRKASMELFLKEQYGHNKRVVLDRVKKDKQLEDALAELVSIQDKLKVLEAEIEEDKNVDLLRRVIADARKDRMSPLDVAIMQAPPVVRVFLEVIRVYVRAAQKVM